MSKRVREKTNSPSPSRGGKADFFDSQRSFLLDYMKNYPPEYSTYLACPFSKHEPDKHEFTKSPCTEGWGFENLRLLMEHLRHDHSLDFGCENCRKRFRDKSKAKNHKENCRETKKIAATKAAWMDQIQNDNFLALNFNNTKVSPSTAWNMICEALWGTGDNSRIPGMYHAPGFLYSCLIYCSPAVDPHLNRRFRRLQRLDEPISTLERSTSKKLARKSASNGPTSKASASKRSSNTLSDLLPNHGSMYANKPIAGAASRKPPTLTDSGYGTENAHDAYVNPGQNHTRATSEGAQVPSTLIGSLYTSNEVQGQSLAQVEPFADNLFTASHRFRDASSVERYPWQYGIHNSDSNYQRDITDDFSDTLGLLIDTSLPMDESMQPWNLPYHGLQFSGESISDYPLGDMEDENCGG